MYIEQKYLLLASSQLSQFKKKNDYLYNFRCPYCGDSQRSQHKARGYVFKKDNMSQTIKQFRQHGVEIINSPKNIWSEKIELFALDLKNKKAFLLT